MFVVSGGSSLGGAMLTSGALMRKTTALLSHRKAVHADEAKDHFGYGRVRCGFKGSYQNRIHPGQIIDYRC